MTMPTPAPRGDNAANTTYNAEEEAGNPAFGGEDTHWSDQESNDPNNSSPTQEATADEQNVATADKLPNTDTGQSGV